LNVSKNSFTVGGLAHVIRNLSYSSTIEEINISELKSVKGVGNDTHELVVAFKKLFKFTISLKKINLWQTPVGTYIREIATKELIHNSSLETLDMVSCGLTNMKFIIIGFMSKENRVRELILDNNSGITFSSIISACDYFDGKDLPAAKKPHHTAVEILKLNSISTFSGNLSTPKNKGYFVKFLHQIFANISELELSHCKLDANSAEGLAEYLKLNPTL
ncbi:hypothetical protein, partial [Salmonella sp. s51228]|uniref:hypothetical protein n=1 Tax=Salmonella sp. s51228 TaxID=3159652 RepID=UPI00397E9BF2